MESAAKHSSFNKGVKLPTIESVKMKVWIITQPCFLESMPKECVIVGICPSQVQMILGVDPDHQFVPKLR